MVLRLDADGNAVTEGSQVEIGGNDRYVSMCRKHFKEKYFV
jgi:thymidine kinase